MLKIKFLRQFVLFTKETCVNQQNGKLEIHEHQYHIKKGKICAIKWFQKVSKNSVSFEFVHGCVLHGIAINVERDYVKLIRDESQLNNKRGCDGCRQQGR